CRMGRALPAVAQCENWAVSRIFYWPITTMSAMRILWRVFSPLARGLVGSTVRAKTASPIFAASVASFTADALAWNLETDDRANGPRVVVFRVTAIAQAMTNCRFGWAFAGHDRSGDLSSIEMYARLEALLERMARPERAARSLVCYPLRVALRSPQRGG